MAPAGSSMEFVKAGLWTKAVIMHACHAFFAISKNLVPVRKTKYIGPYVQGG